MEKEFLGKIKTITIIGVGLIGGSIGLALRRRAKSPAFGGINSKQRVIGVGRHKNKLVKAKKLGAVDEWTTNFEKGVRDADLVVLATPVKTIVPIIKKILPHLKPEAIITDVGSVKSPIVSGFEKLFPLVPRPSSLSPAFIGGHPLAGSEKSGIDYAQSNLFRGAVCFLTPTKRTSLNALETVHKFWELLGAKVLILSPGLHDRLLARSSHLPHLLAAGLLNLISENRSKYSSEVLGPSFRDLTRIASSEPQIWTEISLSNRKEVITALSQFRNILLEIENLLRKRDKKRLKNFFQKAKDYRKKIFFARGESA